MKDDKNKLHAKIQDLEAENEQNNQNIQDLRAELVVFLERIQQLEDENKRLKDDNDILLDKIEELKSQSSLQTVLELLDKIKELEKNCKKPGCTNNTECPSWRACVRYYFPLKIQESLNSNTYLISIYHFNLVINAWTLVHTLAAFAVRMQSAGLPTTKVSLSD